jgi:hypothetical protein
LASFLEAVGLGLGMVARRCFTRHGGEIDDVELVMHNEVLFVSAGEDFLPCRQSDAEALSFACQVMLEEELFDRRLVAQNQAAVASALPAPAPALAPALRGMPAHAQAREQFTPAARSPRRKWNAERPSGKPFGTSLGRTVSFGLSAVDGAVGEPADRWGDPALEWTAAQLAEVPAHLMEGEPPRSTRSRLHSSSAASTTARWSPTRLSKPEPEP